MTESEKSDQQPPAGWYQDNNDPNRQRYWNGTSWTNKVSPHPAKRNPDGPVRSNADNPSLGERWKALGASFQIVIVAAGLGAAAILIWLAAYLPIFDPNWGSLCEEKAKQGVASTFGDADDETVVDGMTEVCLTEVDYYLDAGVYSDNEIKEKMGFD